jgi:hypothetical protein
MTSLAGLSTAGLEASYKQMGLELESLKLEKIAQMKLLTEAKQKWQDMQVEGNDEEVLKAFNEMENC